MINQNDLKKKPEPLVLWLAAGNALLLLVVLALLLLPIQGGASKNDSQAPYFFTRSDNGSSPAQKEAVSVRFEKQVDVKTPFGLTVLAFPKREGRLVAKGETLFTVSEESLTEGRKGLEFELMRCRLDLKRADLRKAELNAQIRSLSFQDQADESSRLGLRNLELSLEETTLYESELRLKESKLEQQLTFARSAYNSQACIALEDSLILRIYVTENQSLHPSAIVMTLASGRLVLSPLGQDFEPSSDLSWYLVAEGMKLKIKTLSLMESGELKGSYLASIEGEPVIKGGMEFFLSGVDESGRFRYLPASAVLVREDAVYAYEIRGGEARKVLLDGLWIGERYRLPAEKAAESYLVLTSLVDTDADAIAIDPRSLREANK